MNSQTKNKNSNPSNSMIALSSLAVLITTTAPHVSSFSIPHRYHRNLPRSAVRHDASSRSTTSAVIAASSTATAATSTRPTTNTQLNAAAAAAVQNVAYLNSLNAIASNPELFPGTSDYIHALSTRDGDASATMAPSAEEFLTQLSTELLRASRREQQSTPSSPSSGDNSETQSFLHTLAESILPATTAAVGVAAAASDYNPTSYSHLGSQRNIMANNVPTIDFNGVDAAAAVGNGGVGDYATAAAAAANVPNAMPEGGTAGYATADYTASSTAASAASSTDPILHTTSEAASSPHSESFAAWHSQVEQGGSSVSSSNSLRDLASSIPTVEPQQQHVGYQGGDYTTAAHDYTAAASSSSRTHDYLGSDAGYYHLMDNHAHVGSQVGAIPHHYGPLLHESAATTAASNAMAYSSEGSVTSALGNLAAAIPTDTDVLLQQQYNVGLIHTDNLINGVNDMVGQFQQQVVPMVQDAIGGAVGDGGGIVDSMAGAAAAAVRDISASMEGSATAAAAVAMDTASTTMDTIPIQEITSVASDAVFTASADIITVPTQLVDQAASLVPEGTTNELANSLSSQLRDLNYGGMHSMSSGAAVAMDAAPTEGAASTAVDTASAVATLDTVATIQGAVTVDPAASLVPQVTSNELTNSLSSQLSDLKDGLQISMDSGAADAGSTAKAVTDHVPTMIDSIKSTLDQKTQLLLPQYHLELPEVFNKVTHATTSSVRGWSHLLNGVGHSMAGMSSSLDSLSRQAGKVGNAGVSGVKTIGEGLAGMESTVKGVGVGMAGMASSVKSVGSGLHLPSLNMQPPTLPDVDLKLPSFQNVNFEAPVLPSINNLPQPTLPSVNMQAPVMPNLNIVEETNTAVNRVGDSSLADFGNEVISAIKFTGGIIVKFLDLILNAIAGTSIESILTSVQSSITSVMDNASHTVVSTITNIGNMSIKEVLQHLMALVVAISDILLKIMNAVIYLISGRDGGDWALQATNTVNEASSHLLSQATSTYDHVTHDSLTTLAHSVGDYSHYVGNEFVTLIGSLNHGGFVGSGGLSLDGVLIPDDMFDSVVTAVQTALSL